MRRQPDRDISAFEIDHFFTNPTPLIPSFMMKDGDSYCITGSPGEGWPLSMSATK
jgi:hypothetical protein